MFSRRVNFNDYISLDAHTGLHYSRVGEDVHPLADEVSRGRANHYFDDSIRSFIEVNFSPLTGKNIMWKYVNEDTSCPDVFIYSVLISKRFRSALDLVSFYFISFSFVFWYEKNNLKGLELIPRKGWDVCNIENTKRIIIRGDFMANK